ncbi:MAG: DNA primase [Flavobacteriales bacterium AspAUS03]
MISRETIDQIFNNARVEEVIGDFMQLKKSGSNYKGLSPFSNERTPSLMVSPAKQIWKDFSSGKGGNVVSFLIEHEHFTYPEALRWLAKKYHIKIQEDHKPSEEESKAANKKETIYIVQDFAKRFFIEQLQESEEGRTTGLSYFKERGFRDETIGKFELGYAPEVWNTLTNVALKKGFKIDYLEKSGLTIIKEGKQSDRFRGRVIFPIHSFSGRVLGFGGRTLKTVPNVAKYLNSPESDIYHKSQILYGLYQAKQAILKENLCYLVEGYTDVISLYQAGVQNVVASSGTALTPDQIRLIKRLTPNVTLLYDGDASGIKASLRNIDLILEQEMNVRILLFPDGEDPDSFARRYPSIELIAFIRGNSQDFIHFKTQLLLEDAQNDPIKKARVIRNIIESIAKIPSSIRREVYVQETARVLQISERVLFNELDHINRKTHEEARKKNKRKVERKILEPVLDITKTIDPLLIVEEELIQLILAYGDTTVRLEDTISPIKKTYETTIIEEILHQFEVDHLSFSLDFYQKIFDQVREGFQQGELRSRTFFIKLFDEKINQTLSSLLTERYQLAQWDKKNIHVTPKEQKLDEHLTEALLRYKSHYLSKLIQDTMENLKGQNPMENNVKTRGKIMRLTELKNQINKKLHRYV